VAPPTIVDLHAHYVPEELVRQIESGARGWEMDARREPEGLILRIRGRDMLNPCSGQYHVPDRIADMDRTGVAWQVMSAAPFLFYYWAAPELAVRIARLTNESMAAAVAEFPGRLRALASVPFSSPRWFDEARAAVTHLGLHGFAVATEFGEEQIDGPTFRSLFKLAVELDVPVFIHPHNVGTPRGLDGNYLINLIGNPMTTTIALGRFAFSGIIDELPTLRTVWAHLGGYVSLAASRLQHGAEVRPEAASGDRLPPAQVMRRIWVDALNHDVRAVRFAGHIHGDDRVVAGTDYCFDMGIADPSQQIASLARIDPAFAERVAWKNAAAVLPGLSLSAVPVHELRPGEAVGVAETLRPPSPA